MSRQSKEKNRKEIKSNLGVAATGRDLWANEGQIPELRLNRDSEASSWSWGWMKLAAVDLFSQPGMQQPELLPLSPLYCVRDTASVSETREAERVGRPDECVRFG
jgi:hypothetical protein